MQLFNVYISIPEEYQSKIHVKTFGTARMQVNLGLCSTGGQGVGGQPISHFVVEFEKG